MTIQTITAPSGEEMVIMSRADYEELIDAREHGRAMTDVAAHKQELIPDSEVDDYLAAPTPLAFWRRRRGLAQAALADQAGISQPFVAQLEAGARSADVQTYARLAEALRVRIDDLVGSDESGAGGRTDDAERKGTPRLRYSDAVDRAINLALRPGGVLRSELIKLLQNDGRPFGWRKRLKERSEQLGLEFRDTREGQQVRYFAVRGAGR